MLHQNTQSLPVAFPGHSWAQGREEKWCGRNRPRSPGSWLTLSECSPATRNVAHPSECSPVPHHMVHPVRVLPSPIAHGSPRQSAHQTRSTWLTMSECSPVPQHMAHHVRVLSSPAAHGSPCQNAPQSYSSACQGFLLSPLPPVRHLSPSFIVRNDPSECGFYFS